MSYAGSLNRSDGDDGDDGGDAQVTLSGLVTCASGALCGIAVQYTVDYRTRTTATDATGRYTIVAPRGTCLIVSIDAAVDVTVTPASYTIMRARSDNLNLNFTLMPIASITFTVSGTVRGLSSVSDIAINYTINGAPGTTTTYPSGNYSFSAPQGTAVVVTPSAQMGFEVAPPNYTIASLNSNTAGQRFVYTGIFRLT